MEKFDLSKYEPLSKEYETLSRHELREHLAGFIRRLLETDPAKLSNMMYRHDVEESKFVGALDLPCLDQQALALADLVIEREMQKVAFRKAYKRQKPEK